MIAIANLSCHGIIDYLQKSYPALSQRELCYCGFICLGFSPESIRILYNHTNTYSIYTLRSKIRSKLGITNDSSNLEKYIVELKNTWVKRLILYNYLYFNRIPPPRRTVCGGFLFYYTENQILELNTPAYNISI